MANSKRNGSSYKGGDRDDRWDDRDQERNFKSSSKRGNSGRKGKGRTSRSTDKGRNGKTQGRVSGAQHTYPLNDMSWYSRNPYLLEAAGRLPFPYSPGLRYPDTDLYVAGSKPDLTSTSAKLARGVMPGLCVLSFYPSIGFSNSTDSPVGQAAREIYAKVREAYSGELPEDPPDIMLYLVCLDSLFSYIGTLKRIYRSITTWSPTNPSLSELVLRAYGFTDSNIATLRTNRTQFWGIINNLIAQVAKFTCPNIMDLFSRHYWMSDNLYADSANPKAQIYMFKQVGFYKFVEPTTTSQPAGSAVIVTPTYTSVSAMANFGKDLVTALANSSDTYTINGHLMRAYGNVPSFTIAPLEESERLLVPYVPEVMMQIHNAQMVNGNIKTTSLSITQDPLTNAIIYKPYIQMGSIAYNEAVAPTSTTNYLIDIPNDAPNVADITVSSRLINGVSQATVPSEDIQDTYDIVCGTEILSDISYSSYRSTDGNYVSISTPTYWYVEMATGSTTGLSDIQKLIDAIGMSAAFDMRPHLYVVTQGDSSSAANTTDLSLVTEIYNPGFMTTDQLQELHRVCVLSEFNAYNIS